MDGWEDGLLSIIGRERGRKEYACEDLVGGVFNGGMWCEKDYLLKG